MKKIAILLIAMLFLAGTVGYAQDVKRAEFAGSWYPGDERSLTRMLDGFFDEADCDAIEGEILGIIVPHAGYIYSAPVAAFGFKIVEGKKYDAVILLGSSHRYYFKGVTIYPQGSFQTPLGNLEVDDTLAKRFQGLSFVQFESRYFDREHCLEVELPFVRRVLGNVKIVPILFGQITHEEMKTLAKRLLHISSQKNILLVISSDLSHFHPYSDAVDIDRSTVELVQKKDVSSLWNTRDYADGRACGVAPIVTFLEYATLLGADVKILKYANSGDTAGDKKRVVGYVSAVAYTSKSQLSNPKSQTEENSIKEGDVQMLNEKQRKRLLEIARKTMEEYVKTGRTLEFTETDPELIKEKGAFVTLHYKGNLRGCIGNIIGRGPLYKTVRDMAIQSSTNDPRFSPVGKNELKDIDIEISVLSEPELETDPNKIIMGKHGVIVKKGFQSGVFLPQVATETGWSREEFLSKLCAHKAGLAPDAWKDPKTQLYTFSAEVFGEHE